MWQAAREQLCGSTSAQCASETCPVALVASCSHSCHNRCCQTLEIQKLLTLQFLAFFERLLLRIFYAPPSPSRSTPAGATALQVKRRDVGAAAASPAQQTENECIISIAFFLPAAFSHFFFFGLSSCYFFLCNVAKGWGQQRGGGGERQVAWGRSGVVALYVCVCVSLLCVCVFIIFRLRKVLCAHTHTYTRTLLHRRKNCERNNWHRLMALTSTALPAAATAALSLSPFGPKKKKERNKKA